MSREDSAGRVLGDTTLSRRAFLKWSAAVGGTAALATGGLSLLHRAGAAAPATPADRIVWQSCMVNCGSRCALRVHVRNGEIVRVETDNTGADEYGTHQVRACVRGRSVRQRIYNVDRLKYPMKRVGARGEGKFQRITWDQALDTIASELKRIKGLERQRRLGNGGALWTLVQPADRREHQRRSDQRRENHAEEGDVLRCSHPGPDGERNHLRAPRAGMVHSKPGHGDRAKRHG